MIIEARDDKVTLSGSMRKNLWSSIQAVAHLLLRQHPNGILIDASGITECTTDGAKTFLEAIEYIERYRARIVLCEVPEAVMTVLRSVPGVRSQVPISETCEAARASLDVASLMRHNERHHGKPLAESGKPRLILAPILPDVTSVREALGLADALGRPLPGQRTIKVAPAQIQIVFIIVVPRALPINAPMLEAEAWARGLIAETEALADGSQIEIKAEIARTRDIADEIAAYAIRLEAAKIVLVVPKELYSGGSSGLVRSVLTKAPCEVVLKR